MNPVHILCTRQFSDDQLARLEQVSPRLVVRQAANAGINSRTLTQALTPEVEILYTTAPPESLESAPALKWIQASGAGIERFATSSVWNSDVLLTTASGATAPTVAEHVLMMMLALSRRLPRMVLNQQESHWSRDGAGGFIKSELRGSTLAIVGYGAIGREVARLAHSFGMRILAVKHSPADRRYAGFCFPNTGDPDGTLPEAIFSPDQLRDALAQARYVVLTVPTTQATTRLIAQAEFAAMPSDAYLINVARGLIVDQQALVDALARGEIAGAALDVTDPEPLPADSPLWHFDNVIVSPHVAGPGPRYGDYVVELFAENLRRYLDGETLLNRVNYARGY